MNNHAYILSYTHTVNVPSMLHGSEVIVVQSVGIIRESFRKIPKELQGLQLLAWPRLDGYLQKAILVLMFMHSQPLNFVSGPGGC